MFEMLIMIDGTQQYKMERREKIRKSNRLAKINSYGVIAPSGRLFDLAFYVALYPQKATTLSKSAAVISLRAALSTKP